MKWAKSIGKYSTFSDTNTVFYSQDKFFYEIKNSLDY